MHSLPEAGAAAAAGLAPGTACRAPRDTGESDVIEATYWNAGTDSAVKVRLVRDDDLPGLLDAILAIRGGRGHPALELTRPDGSSLSIATDGTRCALVWINALEESFHSTGGLPGPLLIYDYNGSWSEAPADWAIPIPDALGCARKFMRHGTPDTDSVLFVLD